MTRFVSLSSMVLCAALNTSIAAQGAPPMRDLGPVTAVTSERVGVTAGLWEFSNGRVLVSDADHLRLIMFDSSLKSFGVVGDSSGGSPIPYRTLISPLIPLFADSVLFLDFTARIMQVIGPNGSTPRTLSAVKQSDMVRIRLGAAGDPRGRLYYRGLPPLPVPTPNAMPIVPYDSAPLVRADFEKRTIDTVAMLRRPSDSPPILQPKGADGFVTLMFLVNPVVYIDDWTVMPDGTVAIVRSHDYHIDWISPDGAVTSSPKMLFDWRRLTEQDKRKLEDSVTDQYAPRQLDGRGGMPLAQTRARGLSEDELHIVTAPDGTKTVPIKLTFVPLNEIPDYVQPLRTGAVQSDRDGNVWILPTTSKQSRHGGLTYDIVNRKDGLFERVELPAGRSLAGFGRNGTIYLYNGNRTDGFVIERARFK